MKNNGKGISAVRLVFRFPAGTFVSIAHTLPAMNELVSLKSLLPISCSGFLTLPNVNLTVPSGHGTTSHDGLP